MIETTDIFIIGGGINGTGIARDAAGRGQKVILVEQSDLASATSSASSKLIHGGLRYLEYYKFRLVRESLQERETLWKIAPHLIKPLRFVLPHHRGMRPAFILRIGLFIYDYIGGRKLLPATRRLDLTHDETDQILQAKFKTAFEYSDCWADDARLVVANALGAASMGAKILTRHRFMSARRENGWWNITVETDSGQTLQINTKILVNAAGPWVEKALNACKTDTTSKSTVRLVKGSHIVVPALYGHDRAYTFQHGDGRVIFAIPYEDKFTLIGTTDVSYDKEPGAAQASKEEIEYLCTAATSYFKKAITPKDVIWTYSGIRPLYDDGADSASAATRDYVLELDSSDGKLPLLSIFGGKITTYRRLAEEALEKLGPFIVAAKGNWTRDVALPGGDLPNRTDDPTAAFNQLVSDICGKVPWLNEAICRRLARTYGSRAFEWLDGVESLECLGQNFGAGLYEKEVDFLIKTEWARNAEDVLWRRTKRGLHMSEDERKAVAAYMEDI